MITSTVITIVCNSCNKSSFVAKGDASFSKGNAYAAAFKDGWKYQSAEVQICPECQEKAAAVKTATKEQDKAAAKAAAAKAVTKKGNKQVDRKGPGKSNVSVKVSAKNNGADKSAAAKPFAAGVSTGKIAKSAKKAVAA